MKQIDGIWWPDCDEKCHPVVPGQVKDVDKAVALCRDLRCAVQAGGNVGIWANHLAKTFDEVWTFEPDPENFQCLRLNRAGMNIRAAPYALGAKAGRTNLELPPHEKNNVGAYRLSDGESIPVVAIDEMAVPACDLIVLDTEGTEHIILEGAKKTLQTHKPILMIEDKGLSEHFGAPKGWTEGIEGYVVVDRVHRDVILAPE